MEGGRFLGSGTYGCAFTPPLLCKGDKQKDYGKVGKITDERFAKQEIQVANLMRKVPLSRNYFLFAEPELCDLVSEEQQTDPGIQQCEDDFGERDDDLDFRQMKQIIQPFGGTKPFYELFYSSTLHPKNFDFFRFMKHMLEAGSTLLKARVVHFDIHPGNMLIDKHKTIRILDFGLAFAADSISDLTIKGRYKRLRFGFEEDAGHPANHNSEPPELTIQNAIREQRYTLHQAIDLTILGKQIFQDIDKVLGISKTTSQKDLQQFWSTSTAAKKRDFVKMWKVYWPGFDAWAIGCILMETLKSLLLLPEFVQGPFHQRKTSVLATLRGLLDPNPKDRLDCMEALALLDPGNPWIARFGQDWLAARKRQRKGKI